jgi:hypothetical protein
VDLDVDVDEPVVVVDREPVGVDGRMCGAAAA